MRAVIYTRVSTLEQTKNLSLEVQEQHCRKYCKDHDLEIAEVFVDRGESAMLEGAFDGDPDAEREAWMVERKRLATEITNLTAVAAAGGNIAALADALKTRDRALRDLDAKLAAPVVKPDREALRRALELRSGQWRDILRGKHVEQGRLILQHLVDLPIRIFNDPKPSWMTKTRPNGMLVGMIQKVASPPPTVGDVETPGSGSIQHVASPARIARVVTVTLPRAA